MSDSHNIPSGPATSLPYHVPALLQETISGLNIKPDGIYADATFGGGGHSRAILTELSPEGHLLGFDQDSDVRENIPDDPRFTFVLSNFRYMRNFMRYHDIEAFDGIMADLGVSFHHFDEASRGFSFREDAPLDMRMNRMATRTAADILNSSAEEDLRNIFKLYTDLKNIPGLCRMITAARDVSPILTTHQLTAAVEKALNPKNVKKDLAQIFQALRIATNGEMDALADFLLSTPDMLRKGGRLAILTYHSIEDRMVKNFFRSGNLNGTEDKDFFGRSVSPWKLITRSPISASDEEVERNPRARSAKLRIAELL